jgi:hypothetical protein
MKLRVRDFGSVYLLEPQDAQATDWLVQHVDAPAWAWSGPAVAVETRFLDSTLAGYAAAGGRLA